MADLEPTGERPTFCREPYEQGMDDRDPPDGGRLVEVRRYDRWG